MAANYNITIEQGATFQFNLIWKDSSGNPIDLTGYTAKMQVRQRYSSEDAALTMSTEAGTIVLGGAAGTINITGPAVDTATITIKQGVYDVELTSAGGIVTRLIEGCVAVSPEVTRV